MNRNYTFEGFEPSIKRRAPHGLKSNGNERRGGPPKLVRSNPDSFVLHQRFVDYGLEHVRNMQLRPDDVWVVTPPKCGTTWMQELSWCVGNNMDLKTAKETLQFYRFPFLDFNHWIPKEQNLEHVDLSTLDQNTENVKTFMRRSFEYIEQMESPRFIKTHLPLSFLPEDLLSTCKVIYVGRNIKDVCVSSFYHLQQPSSFEEYARAFKNGEIMVGNWFEHMKQAWDNRGGNLQFFWYEDMKEDLESVIIKVAQHLNKSLNNCDIKNLSEHLNINSFRSNNSVNKSKDEFPKRDGSQGFIRKGIVGDWLNHFSHQDSKAWDTWIEQQLEETGIQDMRGWKA